MRLATINRWLRVFGFVLVVEVPTDADPDGWITFSFARAKRWPLIEQ